MKVFYCVIPALAVLTACSSGGSSTSLTNIQTTTPRPAPTTPTVNTQIQGTAIAINNGVAGSNTNTVATSDINKVIINGKTIDFIPAGFSTSQINMTSSNINRVGGALDSMRYGYIKDGNATPQLFVQGLATNNMPTSSVARYAGHAVNVNNGAVSTAPANFTVDFGRKTVNGTIGTRDAINLSGTITGNSFRGTTTDGYSTQGQFYGDNASELGGAYRNTAGTVSGAYGAKKR